MILVEDTARMVYDSIRASFFLFDIVEMIHIFCISDLIYYSCYRSCLAPL